MCMFACTYKGGRAKWRKIRAKVSGKFHNSNIASRSNSRYVVLEGTTMREPTVTYIFLLVKQILRY